MGEVAGSRTRDRGDMTTRAARDGSHRSTGSDGSVDSDESANSADSDESTEFAESTGSGSAGSTGPMRSEPPPPAGRWAVARRVLRAAAVVATLPYLTLKAAWLGGSHVGIPDGSVLLDPGPFLVVGNALTLLMDATVILLVMVLTRPWGMRVPGPLLTVPVYVATGLLTPIVLGFPAQLLVKAVGLGADEAARAAREPFLDPWVPDLVYTGFIIQAVALAGLFVPYAYERWGGRRRVAQGQRLPSPTGVVAGAAALVGAAVAAAHLYWAFGGDAGLPAERVAAYSAETGVVSGTHALCALTAAIGAVLLARGGTRRAGWSLAAAWIGSAATLSWGMWLLTPLLGSDSEFGESITTAILLTCVGQIITGALVAGVLIRYLRSRGEV